MKPQEFNAFVAAIVSARQAELLSHETARNVVEECAKSFLPASITEQRIESLVGQYGFGGAAK